MKCIVVLFLFGTACREEPAGPPTMSVHRERSRPAHSRCDECPLLGDVIKVDVRGPSRMARGVVVYLDDRHVKGCFGCDDLSLTIDALGRYMIVGFQMDRAVSCLPSYEGYDSDVFALQRCNAFIVTSEIIVR